MFRNSQQRSIWYTNVIYVLHQNDNTSKEVGYSSSAKAGQKSKVYKIVFYYTKHLFSKLRNINFSVYVSLLLASYSAWSSQTFDSNSNLQQSTNFYHDFFSHQRAHHWAQQRAHLSAHWRTNQIIYRRAHHNQPTTTQKAATKCTPKDTRGQFKENTI